MDEKDIVNFYQPEIQKSSLITIASVATLANAVSIIPYANHMAELQNKGTNKKAFVPEIRLATLKKLLA